MSVLEKLSTLALCPVAGAAAEAVGCSVIAVVQVLTSRFTNHSQRLTTALQRANDRTWKAFEVALGGESFWERCKLGHARAEDKAFREQVRAFLDTCALTQPGETQADVFYQALRELRAARSKGTLTSGKLAAADLAKEAGAFAGFTDPLALLDAEWRVIDAIAAALRPDCPRLHTILITRVDNGASPSLLTVAARYYFRREVETDEQLFRGLAIAKLEALHHAQEKGLSALTEAMTHHRDKLEGLLTEVLEMTIQIRDTTADTNARVRGLEQQIQKLLEQLQLQHREVRPSDSLSVRTEAEQQKVRQVVQEYRALPEASRRQRPGLLNEVGKLEVVAGNFEAAQRDFQEAATLLPDPKAQAEAHHNAYRAALEQQQWDEALKALRQSVQLDRERFAPFPFERYPPERILGAGGFGVVFLCKHARLKTPLVVKALLPSELDRDIADLFAEARALEELNHPGIIRLRDCDFADAAQTRPYLVMDYFPGQTLAEFIAEHGPLSTEDFVPLARQVAEGLREAHSKNILHRDVKPANLLVRREAGAWQVKLIDFGLALRRTALETTVHKQKDRTLTGSSVAGTLEYGAPEQMGKLPGVAVTPATDVYGWGKTCCFALFQTPHPIAKHWRSLSHELSDLLENCLAEDPKQRTADFGKVLERLAPKAAPAKAPRKAAQDKPVLNLKGSDAATLDDLCAADALAKLTEKFQKEKKALAEATARALAVKLWFDEQGRPNNPTLNRSSSKANLSIRTGSGPAIPAQADGSPTPLKTWLTEQGLDKDLAERIAAKEEPRGETQTGTLKIGELMSGSAEQRALAEKLVRLLLSHLLPVLSDIKFSDDGEQFNALVADHLSAAERQLLQRATLPEDLADRATAYCKTPEQLDQLLKLLETKFVISHMTYSGPFERVTEALQRVK